MNSVFTAFIALLAIGQDFSLIIGSIAAAVRAVAGVKPDACGTPKPFQPADDVTGGYGTESTQQVRTDS